MKNKEIASAVVGGTFFAIPYLAVALPLLPSILLGTSAFMATELVLSGLKKEEDLRVTNKPLFLTLQDAKKENAKILETIPLVEDKDVRDNLIDINKTVDKIITAVAKKQKKKKEIDNLFDYYLPVLVKIIKRYDEIENQDLKSKESKKFMESTNKMILEAKDAFHNILSNLYESDIVDADAEMKVFMTMVKSDGLQNEKIETRGDEDE
jgi:hypothetical protein